MGRKSREKRQRLMERLRPPEWTPFEDATMGASAVDNTVTVEGETFRVFRNSRYTVLVRRVSFGDEWPDMYHLSIKRNDKGVIHDWRDMQRIKNEIVGPENEGVELYPKESRLVDSANQYHMYVLVDPKITFPFGYRERLVSESQTGGAKQRPFELKPDDLKEISEQQMQEALRRNKMTKD